MGVMLIFVLKKMCKTKFLESSVKTVIIKVQIKAFRWKIIGILTSPARVNYDFKIIYQKIGPFCPSWTARFNNYHLLNSVLIINLQSKNNLNNESC